MKCIKCGERERHEYHERVFNLCAVCAWQNLQTLFYGENNEYKCIPCDGTGYIDGSPCESCDGVGFYADDLESDRGLISLVVLQDNQAAEQAGAVDGACTCAKVRFYPDENVFAEDCPVHNPHRH